jgi:splicing factor 3A subunit 1
MLIIYAIIFVNNRETEEAIAKGIDPASLAKPTTTPTPTPTPASIKAEPPKQTKVVASSAKAAPINPVAKFATQQSSTALPPLDFLLPHPTGVHAVDIDIIKLTAQYTAVNGRDFLSALVTREQRNPQFDFLKPTHLLFTYFTNLVDAYTRIIHPTNENKDHIFKMTDLMYVLEESVCRWNVKKAEQMKKHMEEEVTDKEKLAFQAIDWNDFVVVEVIDFREDELLEIPGMEGLALNNGANSSAGNKLPPPPPAMGIPMPPPPPPIPSSTTPMVTEEEDEEGTLKVVTNYTPRLATTSSTTKKPLQVVDPVSGKLVEADKLEEHMRIQLLDPKWREEQKRFQEKQKETGFAEGSSIADSLKIFARKRGDIFGQSMGGAGEDSAMMIAQMEAEERRKQEVIIYFTV